VTAGAVSTPCAGEVLKQDVARHGVGRVVDIDFGLKSVVCGVVGHTVGVAHGDGYGVFADIGDTCHVN